MEGFTLHALSNARDDDLPSFTLDCDVCGKEVRKYETGIIAGGTWLSDVIADATAHRCA